MCFFLTNGYGWFAGIFSKRMVQSLWADVPIQSWPGWLVEIDFMRLSPLDRNTMDMNGFGVSICILLFDYSDYNIYIYFFYNLINLMIQSSHARWRTTTSIETENIFHPFPINRDVSSIYWQIRFSFHTASSMFTNTIVFHKNLSYGNMTKLLWVTPVFCQKLFISHRCPAFPEKQASQLLKKGCISPRHLEDSASSAGTVHSISVVDSARFTPDQAVFGPWYRDDESVASAGVVFLVEEF